MFLFYAVFGLINSVVAVALYVYSIITGDTDPFIAGTAFAALALAQLNAADLEQMRS